MGPERNLVEVERAEMRGRSSELLLSSEVDLLPNKEVPSFGPGTFFLFVFSGTRRTRGGSCFELVGGSRVLKSFAWATGGFEDASSEVLADWDFEFLVFERTTGGFSSPSRQLETRSEQVIGMSASKIHTTGDDTSSCPLGSTLVSEDRKRKRG